MDDIKDTKKVLFDSTIALNQLYQEDCLSFMQKIPDESIDLIFADPPYNLSKSNFKIEFSKMASKGADLTTNKGAWDAFDSQADYETFSAQWIQACYRILKTTGSLWVAGTYHNIYLMGYLINTTGFTILNEILWQKTDATPNISCTRFVADHENFIWARKGTKHTFNYETMKKANNGKQMRSIWPKGKTSGGKKIHPTQKPEWLLERILLACSNEGDLVFDPFMGSGTTAVVAKKLNRIFVGCDIDPAYVKAANKRLQMIPARLEEYAKCA
ncbi:MAG: site-specific DNA-methyltransferase [Candidatus Thermoplasmatota archaeon]|nr:site-specific DNA-methyltransferase [Candidatus Thermoplasmatota archaeon]